MTNFKEHDGLLFKMLEEPVPLRENDENVLVRFITHGVIGEYVMEHWLDCNQKNVPIYVEGVDSDGDVTVWIDDVHHCCPFPMFEIIGTFVKEGSADWALYQMMQGNKVRNRDWDGGLHEKSLLYCQLIGETIKHNEGCSALDVCLSDWEAPYIKNTGWQIYKEPKPESQYKVGDWVKCKDLAGVPAQCKVLEISKHNVILECTTGHIWSLPHNNIIRKLSPSEIIVTIGCLSGTIAKSCDPNYFLMLHSCPITDCNHSMIRFTAIDKETREFVEGLLDAQEEEK